MAADRCPITLGIEDLHGTNWAKPQGQKKDHSDWRWLALVRGNQPEEIHTPRFEGVRFVMLTACQQLLPKATTLSDLDRHRDKSGNMFAGIGESPNRGEPGALRP